MSKKPWGGRFKAETDELMLVFSESVSFDWRLLTADLRGSVAHARMLGERGIITRSEARKIIAGLTAIAEEAESGKFPLRLTREDVHMNVEARLREKIGAVAGKLHTGRSRNDQVALDLRIYFREEALGVAALLFELTRSLISQAETNLSAIMPGFTHTRKAQPVLFSHHLLAYVEMFLRDSERFRDCLHRMNFCPLGAGALAGTTFPINREMTAEELGFRGPTENSIDSVSDRDFLLEFAAAGAITMSHLSRLMEELIWWGLPELGFIELPENFCTGSSMMPNKKNPDAAELIRGKTGRVTGALMSLLMTMKGTPLAYNRDFQEDKPGLFDLVDTLRGCLVVANRLVEGMIVHADRMKAAAQTGFILATDLADYLVTKGLPFRDAHEVAGKLVRYCEENGKRLEDLGLNELKKFSPLFKEDVRFWLSLSGAVKRRNQRGGTAPEQVKKQIQRLNKMIGPKTLYEVPTAPGKPKKKSGK